MNACRYELDQISSSGFQSRRSPRGHPTPGFARDEATPLKMMRGNGGFRRPSGSYRGNNFGGNSSGFSSGFGMGGRFGRGGNWGGGRGRFRGRY